MPRIDNIFFVFLGFPHRAQCDAPGLGSRIECRLRASVVATTVCLFVHNLRVN
jgi:hypothetical protein